MDTIFDIWTWSWIIGITLAKEYDPANVYLLEKSKKAIEVASENVRNLGADVRIFESDLLGDVFADPEKYVWLDKRVYFAVNLPYIKDNDWKNMSEDTVLEPKMALFGWKKTWFELYEKFFKQIFEFKSIFKPEYIWVVAEIWFDQEEIANNFFDWIWIRIRILPDLSGVNRFITFEI